jgi:formylglycine-generating enzyme required for sulfatase activity
LILALGTYGTEGLSAAERESLYAKLLDRYRNDPDAGIHGASEWTLRQGKQQEMLKAADAGLMTLKDHGDRRWTVNGQGQTFAVIDGPVEFLLGSPPTEPDRVPGETLRRVRIPRRFAIAFKEVSVEQYQRFVRTNPALAVPQNFLDRYSPDPGGPVVNVSWYGAAAYCNWLSEQEGLPREEWCYIPAEGSGFTQGMTIPADVLRRTGYRLPTEAEWEYACRSGTITSRYYGLSTDLLGTYAWCSANSRDQAWPAGSLMPNDLGLFDMLGHCAEWCQERQAAYKDSDDQIRVSESVYEYPRLLRGGAYLNPPKVVRSAIRAMYAPSNQDATNGFRPARTYP